MDITIRQGLLEGFIDQANKLSVEGNKLIKEQLKIANKELESTEKAITNLGNKMRLWVNKLNSATYEYEIDRIRENIAKLEKSLEIAKRYKLELIDKYDANIKSKQG